MKTCSRIILTGCLFGAAPHFASAAAESSAPVELRQTINRFWGLAESRVEDRNTHLKRAQSTSTEPVILRSLGTGSCRGQVVGRSPSATVKARQVTESRQRSEHFGLNLLGGLEIFRFTWGGETQHEADELQGDL